MIQLSNDRWNIQVAVVEMLHSANSFHDIKPYPSLTARNTSPEVHDILYSRQDTQRMTEYLHSQLQPELQHKIVWFHSGMMQEFRTDMMAKVCAAVNYGYVLYRCCRNGQFVLSHWS
ncbi:hypothetical protein DFJ58DRAFT_669387 [Suillus subalutaceus]|uniref:uncharacterized protein n=1 Tax=Suillus subalutaceus TaxID=48586 RepID=UPI001B85BBA9|nr:uncharacterized protein DFJ58DRAFT_669387 [Suillus subalutaceus]KAG1836770.1 hypothetical protein DFJ58DRAFT_669387 [Suillus subalutaceus]